MTKCIYLIYTIDSQGDIEKMKETLKLEPQQVIEFINYVKRLTLDGLTDLTCELTCIEYELLEEKTTKIIQANSITRIDLLK